MFEWHSGCGLEKYIAVLSKNLYFDIFLILLVCMTDQFMVAAFPDKSRVDYIYFCKRPPYGEALKKIDKLSAWEPKVSHCILICL